MAPSLLGPPILRSPVPTLSAADPPLGLTENKSATYLATGSPCLDFFFHIVPDTPSKEVIDRLEKSWANDPLTTLKLICNLRGVRGTGKSDKAGFYTSSLWLHKKHPKTLACNIVAISEFGYFKDFLEILYRLVCGKDVREKEKQVWEAKRYERKRKAGRKLIKSTSDREKVLSLRHDKTIDKAKKAIEKYTQDPNYHFLHEKVSDFFAEMLKSDMNFLNKGELKNISLAAKWCPSMDSSFDKATLIYESIAKKYFPREEYIEYSDIEDMHYAYKTRARLRKEVLVPLREALKLPEVYMCAKKWDKIPYNRVASVAMKIYKKLYYKHDKERFEEYLEKVKSGKSTIAAGALLPHEIIGSLNDEGGAEVAELQWKRMVDDMAKKGKLSNCLAICDVSGSMSGIPMEVSVALGLLISELSEETWNGKLITFSADPQLHLVQGDSLKSKTDFIRNMDWGMNTDFQKVFDLILAVAVKAKITPDQMIKRLFVFSDMEFDEALGNYSYGGCYKSSESESEEDSCTSNEPELSNEPEPSKWDTDYEVIRRKFQENGYGEVVPEIVFWNLRNSRATPVPSNQKGVALVSGYSKNLMTMFLEDGELESPLAVMEKAIAGEEYQKLVVFD